MPIAAEEAFNRKVDFLGDRINTCMFRFHQMLTTRQDHLARMVQDPSNETVQEEARTSILGSADRYINCLRNQYESPLPEIVQPAAEQFKRKLYTNVEPTWVLQDERLKVATLLFEASN